MDPIEKEANAFASELLLPIADRYGEDIRNPALMETVARTFNVSRDALFYRLTQLEICFWNEKTQFASPFENTEPNANRVTNIALQVSPQFLETAVASHIRQRGLSAQFYLSGFSPVNWRLIPIWLASHSFKTVLMSKKVQKTQIMTMNSHYGNGPYPDLR